MLKSDTWGCAKAWEDLAALEALASLYFGNLPCRVNYVTR